MTERKTLLKKIETCDRYFSAVAKSYAEQKILAEQADASLDFLRITSDLGEMLMRVMQVVGKETKRFLERKEDTP